MTRVVAGTKRRRRGPSSTMPRRMLPWLASACGHAAIVAGVLRLSSGAADAPISPIEGRLLEPVAAAASDVARPIVADADRRELVAWAQEARSRGTLDLGEFLIRAGLIDATESGESLDADAARTEAMRYRSLLVAALGHEPPEKAVPEVFADLRYNGTPGGRAIDALLRHEGSCEPLSQVIAASLHDAGFGDRARLTFYGGAVDGVTHLAPTLSLHGSEHDLMSGRDALPGGTTFPAGDLVDAYARAHGIGPPLTRSASAQIREGAAEAHAGEVALAAASHLSSITSGFPPNDTRFEGGLPLFAERAVAAPAGKDAEQDAGPGEGCPALPAALLDPPRISTLDDEGDGISVDLVKIPSRSDLTARSRSIVALERVRASPKSSLADRLAADACLAGLYDQIATGFALTRERALARRAAEGAKAARDDGRGVVATLMQRSMKARDDELLDVLVALDGRAYVLLFLDDTDDLAFELLQTGRDSYWAVELVAGLLIAPRSRERAIPVADQLPLARQIDVMHELTHAHDNARPWASSYALELSPTVAPELRDSRFVRGYRTLRPAAWSLWEAQRDPGETVTMLVANAKEEKLDPEMTSAIAGYYERNFWWLFQHREGGPEKIEALESALGRHGLRGAAGERALTPGELGSARNPP